MTLDWINCFLSHVIDCKGVTFCVLAFVLAAAAAAVGGQYLVSYFQTLLYQLLWLGGVTSFNPKRRCILILKKLSHVLGNSAAFTKMILLLYIYEYRQIPNLGHWQQYQHLSL